MVLSVKKGENCSPYAHISKRGVSIFLIILFSLFSLLLLMDIFLQFFPTGWFILDLQPRFIEGEQIKGNVNLMFSAGELIPIDSLVYFQLGSQEKVFKLADLINSEKSSGNFYAKNSYLSGNGEGYGLIGEKKENPVIEFQLKISSIYSSDSGDAVETPIVETIVDNSETTLVETPVEMVIDSSSDSSNSEGTSVEVPSDSVDSERTSSDSSSGSSNLITGAVVSSRDNIVSGSVSKGKDFVYNLADGESYELIAGSVMVDGESIDSNLLNLNNEGNKLVVSTDYEFIENGFGEDFKGGGVLTLSLSLENLNLTAEENASLNVNLVYQENVIANVQKDLIVLSNEKNETVEQFVSNLSIVKIKDLPLVRIKSGENATIDLAEYFHNAESYGFNVDNVSGVFDGSILTLVADEHFKGSRKANVIAYGNMGLEILESNQFLILVSNGAVSINVEQSKVRVGELVKWTVSVSSDVAENISLDVPVSAENISVVKIGEDGMETGVEARLVKTDENGNEVVETISSDEKFNSLTGNVIADVSIKRRNSIFVDFFKKVFSSITGRVVDGSVISDISQTAQLNIDANATNYTVEYYTEAPKIAEQNISGGKQVVVYTAAELGYTNVLAFTNINESLNVGQENVLSVYWVENNSYLPFDAYDLNDNGKLDYVEWVVPHLSNQTFDISYEVMGGGGPGTINVTEEQPFGPGFRAIEHSIPRCSTEFAVSTVGLVPDFCYVSFDNFQTNYTLNKFNDSYFNSTVLSNSSNAFGIGYKFWCQNGSVVNNTIAGYFDLQVTPECSNRIYNCSSLNVLNKSYFLMNNVSTTGTCFNITADNITLDGNGYSIAGDIDASKFGARAYTNLTINNTLVNGNIEASGADSASSSGFAGGNLNLVNSLTLVINTFGGSGNAGVGGIGGNVLIINSSAILINTTGGKTIMGAGGRGGSVNLINSNLTKISTNGGYAPGPTSGNGGNITLVNSNINLIGASIDFQAGWGATGLNGTFKLNQTSFNNDFGEIRFGYVLTNKKNFVSILSISNNSAYVNSTSYPDYNVSSDITLNLTGLGISTPRIMKDGLVCSAPNCNVLSYSNGVVVFNVSSWSNYTIAEGFVPGISSDSNSNDWRMFGKYLNHTRWDGANYPLVSGLNRAAYGRQWGNAFSSPVVANGFVYTVDSYYQLYQLNASNISQALAIYSTGGYYLHAPIVANGYLYTGDSGSPWGTKLYQFNASNITQLIATYSKSGGYFDSFYSAPILANGSIFIGSGDHSIYQLNASNISQYIANYTTSNDIEHSPAVSNGYLYVPSYSALYQLNASNISQFIASQTVPGVLKPSSPTVSNGYVYIGSGYGLRDIYQLNASNISQVINTYRAGGNSVDSSPAIANGYLYIGAEDGKLYQLNASNISKFIASYTTGAGIYSSPTVADGYVYIGSDDGSIYKLNASNVSQYVSSFNTGAAIESNPAVANGYVYVGTAGSTIYQLNVSNLSLDSVGTASNPRLLYDCGELNISGVYRVENNISATGTCFNITANGVTLNGNGFTVVGNGVGSGIYSNGRNYTNITNFMNISGFFDGLYFESGSNNFLSNLLVSHNANSGIWLYYGSNNSLSGINSTFNNVIGLASSLNSYNLFSNVNSNNNVVGFVLSSSSSNFFSNIDSNSNSNEGVYFEASSNKNTFLNCNIYSNSIHSLSSDEFSGSSVNNSLVYNNSYGEIKFIYLNLITDLDSNIRFGAGQVIQITNNSAYVNSDSLPELNISANVTLNLIGQGITNPQILKNGVVCESPNCKRLNYSSSFILFNVSSWSNYTIRQDPNTAPNITQNIIINQSGSSGGVIEKGDNVTINVTVSDSETQVQNVWITIWQGVIGGPILLIQQMLNYFGNLWTVTFATNSSFNLGTINYTIYANDSGEMISNLSGNFTLLPGPGDIFNCGEINSSGVYTLQTNISGIAGTCFTITADNVILDGNGFNIIGNNDDCATDYGVYVFNRTNITVLNFAGISQFGDYDFCQGGYFGSWDGAGIKYYGVNNSLFVNNTLSRNMGGISANGPFDDPALVNQNNTFTNLNLLDNTGVGIQFYMSYNGTVSNITATSSIPDHYGLGMMDTHGIILSNIYFLNNGPAVYSGSGSYIDTSSNNTFYNYTAINFGNGIYLDSSLNNNFSEVFVINNSQGLYLYDSTLNNEFNNFYSYDNTNQEVYSDNWVLSIGNKLEYNNSYGIIRFIPVNVDITSDIVFGNTQPIQIANNSAYLNSSALPGLNISANVTLYNLLTNMLLPKIMKDGIQCNDCYNFTSLNAGNVTFNVSSWSNYKIQDSSSLTSCAVLNVANTVYTLQNNVSTTTTCFNITADNVTLDGNGYSIAGDGSGTSEYGFYASGKQNLTITNFKNVVNFTSGVRFETISNPKIYNSNFASLGATGVSLVSSDNVIVENISVNNSITGIELWNSNNGLVRYNNLINTSTGISIAPATNSTVIFNNISLANYGVGFDSTVGCRVENNLITSSGYFGIGVGHNSVNNVLKNNLITLTNNTYTPGNPDISYGIVLWDNGSNNVFENNTVAHGSRYGISIESGNSINNSFINNQIYNNSYLDLDHRIGGTNTLIYNNSFGQIVWVKDNLTSVGNLTFPGTIQIANNSAYVNSGALTGLNVSANVTLYHTSYAYPKILKDGAVCSDCVLLSSLGSNHTFNVSSWSNYTLAENSDVTTCRVLNQPNTVYTLQNNVSATGTCFNITSDNVTLDGNGYAIEGIFTYSGIIAIGKNNLIVKNFRGIKNFDIGVYFDGVNNSHIFNNTLINNSGYSSILLAGNWNNLTNNFIYSSSSTIGFAILTPSVGFGGNNNVSGNSVINASTGITLSVSNNFVSNNTIVGSLTHGISIWNKLNNTILQNTIVNCTEGIVLANASSNFLSENLINGSSNGFALYFASSDNQFINNIVLNSRPYSLLDYDSVANNYLVYNNTFGKIIWTSTNFTTVGNLTFPGNIKLADGSAYLNSSALPELNISANVTFYGLPINVSEMYNASVLFNEGNGKMSCANCNLLNSSDSDSSVTFNVSDFGNSRNYSVGGVDVVALNSGWNSVSFIMDGLTNSSKNISVSAGWNLIGLSGDSNVNVDDLNFTNNGGTKYKWSQAVTSMKVQDSVVNYDSSSKKFKIARDDAGNNMSKGKGYWVYAREAGNLTLPNVRGAGAGKSYKLNELMFSNGTAEMNLTNAVSANWTDGLVYYYSSSSGVYDVIQDYEDLGFCEAFGYKCRLTSSDGYFIKSLRNNIVAQRKGS